MDYNAIAQRIKSKLDNKLYPRDMISDACTAYWACKMFAKGKTLTPKMKKRVAKVGALIALEIMGINLKEM